MAEAPLFVYGTLRHDQPEHRQYCRGVTGWCPARVRGRLVRIPEGYLLLVVPSSSILLRASAESLSDEFRREKLSGEIERAAMAANADEPWPWIEGELLTFADAAVAWPPLDEWEGFIPGRDAVYQRCVIPVEVGDAAVPAWTYATPNVPQASRSCQSTT